MSEAFTRAAATLSSAVEKRLFSEYGAIFLTRATPPPKILFADSAEVEEFQSSLATQSAMLGDYLIELQSEAMDALHEAAAESKSAGGRITARADDAGRRSYEDTVRLWTRNVTRGLDHWQREGRITSALADEIAALSPSDQVQRILALEDEEQIYFGTFFDKSILYSVAAPGASQHLSLLAFDVAEFEDDRVEQVMADFGWHRTVVSDFPHFTYLGRRVEDLPGLKRVSRAYKGRDYFFLVPDMEFHLTGSALDSV
ncbi:MAG: hypothetical protein AB1631_09020 [Acidobacteriota bacterium]